jgi:hypothetical protein
MKNVTLTELHGVDMSQKTASFRYGFVGFDVFTAVTMKDVTLTELRDVDMSQKTGSFTYGFVHVGRPL